MRYWALLLVWSFSIVANGNNVAIEKLESFSAQISPLWKTLKPACTMSMEPSLQKQLIQRTTFLSEQMVASQLLGSLQSIQANNVNWASPLWQEQLALEQSALALENRESLREYFFKLQTPNPERAKLVSAIQYMSQTLNVTLRKELWKTCHSLGYQSLPSEQLEAALDKRWLSQEKKVTLQVKRELAAFYFYVFRQTSNDSLQQMAQLNLSTSAWVQAVTLAITDHFQLLRSQLTATPFVMTDSIDEPFLQDRPWPQVPSQGLIHP